MTRKLNIDRGYSDTKEGRPAGNSVYMAIAGEVVNRRSVLLKNIVLNGQVSASNPLLHIHAKRCTQAEKRHSSNMIADLKREKMENANPQKQECGCPSLQPSLRSHTHAFFPTHAD